MLSLLVIAATASGAFFGAPWWIVVLGGAVLFFQSNAIFGARGQRLRASGDRSFIAEATAICLGNAMFAGGSAFALGYVTRLTFGA